MLFPKKKKVKKVTRTQLVKEADRVFSLYVRERDKWKPCVTCGKLWEETFQCGHFQSRRHYNTRWMEKNAHGQCPWCNLWWAGEQYKHGQAVDSFYWLWTAECIARLANDPSKTTDGEILMHIRYFYSELDRMMVKCPKKKFVNAK